MPEHRRLAHVYGSPGAVLTTTLTLASCLCHGGITDKVVQDGISGRPVRNHLFGQTMGPHQEARGYPLFHQRIRGVRTTPVPPTRGVPWAIGWKIRAEWWQHHESEDLTPGRSGQHGTKAALHASTAFRRPSFSGGGTPLWWSQSRYRTLELRHSQAKLCQKTRDWFEFVQAGAKMLLLGITASDLMGRA